MMPVLAVVAALALLASTRILVLPFDVVGFDASPADELSLKLDVLIGTSVAKDKTRGSRAEVRVITARPPQAAGQPEPEFTAGMVWRGFSGVTPKGRESLQPLLNCQSTPRVPHHP